jgi:UDPglucose--hexose-1-phosphate uridylyltransferase
MLCEYAHAELKTASDEGRIVISNEHWLAIVPWWATWPFETMGKRYIGLMMSPTD